MSRATTSRLTWLDWLLVVLLWGYMTIGRSFAHLGVSPVYVGELALVALLFLGPHALLFPWLGSLMRPTGFGAVSWLVFVSLLFGVVQVIRGIALENDTMTALMNLVFHIYPLFLFGGLWLGLRHPDLLPRFFRVLAWSHGIYGILYLSVLPRFGLTVNPLDPSLPAWFSTPDSSAVVLIALLCFETNARRRLLPLLLNLAVLLGVQGRSEWLALVICIPLWAVLAGRSGTVVRWSVATAALFLIAVVTDLSLPSPATRGGEVSARNIGGKIVSVVDPHLAKRLSPSANRLDGSTVSWRTEWWGAIWDTVHASAMQTFIGPGYGFAIWDLHPDHDVQEKKLRTPHNAFIYALGYTGWLGVMLFLTIQLTLGGLLWHSYQVSGQPFGFCFWVLVMIRSNFDVFFESPYFAIPYYLVIGFCIAPLVLRSSMGCATALRLFGIEESRPALAVK